MQYKRVHEVSLNANRHSVSSLFKLLEMRSVLQDVNFTVKQFQMTKDASALAPLERDLERSQMRISQIFDKYLQSNLSDAKERALMFQAQTSYKQYIEKIWLVMHHDQRSVSNALTLPMASVDSNNFTEIMLLEDHINDQLVAIENYNARLAKQYESDALKFTEQLMLYSEWGTAAIVVFVIFFVGMIRRSAVKRLGGTLEDVEKVIARVMDNTDANIQLDADKNASMLNAVSHLILHDRLTQLPNRLALSHQMQSLLGHGVAPKCPFSFLKIEMNGLKDMADIVGHGVVDDVRSLAINRMQPWIPDTFLLASIDGDTFGLLMPNITSYNTIEQYAQSLLSAFTSPLMVGKQNVVLTINIGIVCYSDQDAYQDKNNWLEFARLALKHSKADGKNHYAFYCEAQSQQHRALLQIEGALHHVVQNNELALYYQPQVDIHTAQIIGAEALIRWKHPTLGMIPPDQFIPLAEKNGSIIEIGDWVMLRGFEAAAAWNIGLTTPIRISINLSAIQVAQKDFISKIENLIKMTGCKPEWIKLEITESLLMKNTEETMSALISLVELGIPISMDDFGTGYSSLSYLTTYPISQLKIDRSFMNDIPTRLDKCEVVKMIMRIAEIIHADVVAEGVETAEQVEFLCSIKCNVVQGYYYYKPMPFDDFDQMVTALRQDVLKQQATAKNDRKKNKIVQFPSHQA